MSERSAIIKRDGAVVATVPDNEDAILRWFHRHCSGSMDWAIKYEGYSVASNIEDGFGHSTSTSETGLYLTHSDLSALVRIAKAARDIVGDHCMTHVNLTDGCPYCEVASLL